MDQKDDLERALGVLWMALDGDRALQRGDKTVFTEAAAGLVREIRAVTAELARLTKPEGVDLVDEIAQRRNTRRSVSPKGQTRTKRSV